jgi:FlaA1/EpsC-like NDP-sugar epimerase
MTRKNSRVWWSRLFTKKYQIIVDITILVFAFTLAYLLRFDFQIPPLELFFGAIQLPFVVLLQLTSIVMLGIYTFIWRYIGMAEVKPFVKAAALSALTVLALRLTLPDVYSAWRVPISVIVIDSVLAFGGILSVRVFRRAVYERYEKRQGVMFDHDQRKPVLLIGAGNAGMMAVKEIRRT